MAPGTYTTIVISSERIPIEIGAPDPPTLRRA